MKFMEVGLISLVILSGQVNLTKVELLSQENKRPNLESVIETIRNFPVWQRCPASFSSDLVRDIAEKITVKIFSENSWGSGIIIARQGSLYTVVTNAHVLQQEQDQYRLQTNDGVSHSSWRLKQKSLANYDLALLQFDSPNSSYEVAHLGHSSNLKEGDTVIASGFPFRDEKIPELGLKITEGKISLLSEKSLKDGYQIGYTNDVQKGMSGGPVLNLKGEVIAISGIHAYPLWGEPYIYQDGEKPPESMIKLMEKLAWAIPIDTFLQLSPQFNNQKMTYTINSDICHLSLSFVK